MQSQRIQLIFIKILFASLTFYACQKKEPGLPQDPHTVASGFIDETIPADSPLRNHPIARVKKVIGTNATIVPATTGEPRALTVNMDVWMLDQIRVGENTRIELNLIDRRLLFQESIPVKSLVFPSSNLVRLAPNTIGSFSYFSIHTNAPPMLIFELAAGKGLFHMSFQEYQFTVRTPQIDCRSWGQLFLVEASDKGSWVGVLMDAVEITFRKKPPTTWVLYLIRGEQLLPEQVGTFLSLDTEEVTANNYSINEIKKTDPLLTQFAPLPKDSQTALSKWGDRQQYRWGDYVRMRNEQRRDLTRSIERVFIPTPANTIIEVSSTTR